MSEQAPAERPWLAGIALRLGVVDTHTAELWPRRTMLANLMAVVGVLALGWGAVYAAFDEEVAAAWPLTYAVLTGTLVLVLRRTGAVALVLLMQVVLIVTIPFALAVTLGGFVASSGVILWSLLGPIAAFLIGGRRSALLWLAIYLLLVALLAALHPLLRDGNNLPTAVVLTFFVLNLGTVSAISFAMIVYFVGENERAQAQLRRQEEELRQTEKISALGKLSAGLAHELNNPAAAAQRASSQLREALSRLSSAAAQMSEAGLTPAQRTSLAQVIDTSAASPAELGALERADREEALAAWLSSRNVEHAWQLVPSLVSAGIDASTLAELTSEMPDAAIPSAAAWLSASLTGAELLATLTSTTTSMLGLVSAVKSYSYMDRAQEQEIDIHEGIENTLTILGHKLKPGVTITRTFDRSLPRIVVAGGELNQVWTNLLDNAIDAAGSGGEVGITTRRDRDHLVVEIADNGGGIPVEVQTKVFDPFFTTKDVGEGMGLGLDIARRIVTDRCGGEIAFESEPGATRFWVRLPLQR